MMKNVFNSVLALMMLTILGVGSVNAQDVTDEDIKKYAIIELAKNSIIDDISPMVNEMIEKQEGMTGQRFMELQQNKGEGAEDWEKQFLDVVNKQIDKKKAAATDVVKLLASNSMGAAAYKATKTAIDSNADVKAKFEGYLAAFQ